MTEASPTEHTVLVVDDSEATLEVLRRNLESQSYVVFTAPDVPEALRVLKRHSRPPLLSATGGIGFRCVKPGEAGPGQ